jgi:hypothetical protein
MENRKWKMENGKWKMENGKWKMRFHPKVGNWNLKTPSANPGDFFNFDMKIFPCIKKGKRRKFHDFRIGIWNAAHETIFDFMFKKSI